MTVPYIHKASRLHIILWTLLVAILIYTRVVNLSWGLPYPFHPDERNMVDAIMRLHCPAPVDIHTCANPEFFAYGQAPLYIGAASVKIWHFLSGRISDQINFSEAALSLRLQSVVYSLLTIIVMMKLLLKMFPKKLSPAMLYTALLFFTFQPFFIQFSHFGTTESLLMLLYTSIVLLTFDFVHKRSLSNILSLALLVGVSIGVKISSVLFAGVPLIALTYSMFIDNHLSFGSKVRTIARYALLGGITALIAAVATSPQSFIHYREFLGSMNYEIAVGNGALKVFYTRQFENTIPYLYQFLKVFPYSHGGFQLLIGIAGFLFLSWKDIRINLLRFAFVIYFIAAGGTYVKWARFMAPIMPLITLIAYVFLITHTCKIHHTRLQNIILTALVSIMILPGIAYLSVYRIPDTRYQASTWMARHIKPTEHVLLESGNVINLPIMDPQHPDETELSRFSVTPFDFYALDESPSAQDELINEFDKADYVVIASRRVFANHTCLWPDPAGLDSFSFASGRYLGWCLEKQRAYPMVNIFFTKLFNPTKYQLVQTFASPPQIKLWDSTMLQLSDEQAEEAWTVFDHPTVRIYKKL